MMMMNRTRFATLHVSATVTILITIIVKNLAVYTTPFKDDIRQLADLNTANITKDDNYVASHRQNVTVLSLRSNIIFLQ